MLKKYKTGCRGWKFLILGLLALTACDGSGDDNADVPQGAGTVSPIGPSCHSSDPTQNCLALKYVVYSQNGTAVANASTAISNLSVMNSIWAQCNISFEIEDFVTVDPNEYGLNFSPSETSELDDIREAFQNANQMLQVTTGTWNRSGSLGSSSANAWTTMPGSDPVGSVFEEPVANFGNIYAHELGHYMNLYHVPDVTDVMNATIYYNSTILTSDQCSTVVAAVQQNWSAMLR